MVDGTIEIFLFALLQGTTTGASFPSESFFDIP
jgi:hypothetical protein